MQFIRFAALFIFVSFAFAVPTAKVPNEVAARSIEARGGVVSVGPELGLTKRDASATDVEFRQVVSLGGLVRSLLPLLNGVPLVGNLLATFQGLLTANISLADLQSGAKTIQDLANSTGVPATNILELFSRLPLGTIPGLPDLSNRELPVVGGLFSSLLPLLSGVPLVGSLLTTLLGLLRTTVSLADLQNGTKTITDLANVTGLPVDNINALFSRLPAGTIPGL